MRRNLLWGISMPKNPNRSMQAQYRETVSARTAVQSIICGDKAGAESLIFHKN